ncbi:hypothetical protein TYRP_008558 [Tyrophagus putrescentiae]|nr:hypothetical protein TYRP_008558 [Tyrophagus putrescentiae]
MASDKAIRERSRAWSGGWLSHRLAAAQRLVCELSDDMNVRGAFPRVVSPPHVLPPSLEGLKCQRAFKSQSVAVTELRLRRPAALCAPIIIAGLFAVPCPVPRAPCPVPRARARALVFGLPSPCVHPP